ncbi:hypothetical protein Trydic_g4580 [Trypoxylus dichotomus]
MASRTAPMTVTPDMEKTTAATATATIEKIGTSKQSAREERRARRRGEAVDAIRMLQDALPLANESTSDTDSDDCSTIVPTSVRQTPNKEERLAQFLFRVRQEKEARDENRCGGSVPTRPVRA